MPFGYERVNGKIVVNTEKAEIYQKIVSMYLSENYSMRDVAIKLTAQGIPSPSKRSVKWHNVTVSDILKNPAYTGERKQNQVEFVKKVSKVKKKQYYCASRIEKPKEQWITIQYPPLIAQDRFDQIRARIENQKRKPKKHHKGYENHFMAENVLFCGYCGSRIRKRKTPIDNFFYCCYWWETSARDRLISNRQKCILNPIDADTVDNDIFHEVVKILSRPAVSAKNWLRNFDIEGLKKSIEMMRKREEELKALLSEGFRYIINTKDSELKKLYQREIKRNEDEFRLNQKNLKDAEANLAFAQNRYDRLAEFERAINGEKAQRIRAMFSTTSDIMKYLYQLPLTEKKRIMEAVIDPANGGKVLLRYGTKEEDCEGEVVLDLEFNMDIDRNESLINSLNRKELFKKVGSR